MNLLKTSFVAASLIGLACLVACGNDKKNDEPASGGGSTLKIEDLTTPTTNGWSGETSNGICYFKPTSSRKDRTSYLAVAANNGNVADAMAVFAFQNEADAREFYNMVLNMGNGYYDEYAPAKILGKAGRIANKAGRKKAVSASDYGIYINGKNVFFEFLPFLKPNYKVSDLRALVDFEVWCKEHEEYSSSGFYDYYPYVNSLPTTPLYGTWDSDNLTYSISLKPGQIQYIAEGITGMKRQFLVRSNKVYAIKNTVTTSRGSQVYEDTDLDEWVTENTVSELIKSRRFLSGIAVEDFENGTPFGINMLFYADEF